MEQQHEKNSYVEQLRLLPGYYKIIGGLVSAIGFFGLLLKKWGVGVVIGANNKQPDGVVAFFTILLILGLTAVAWTREKVEDEFTVKVRLRCAFFAFISGVLYEIIVPVISPGPGNAFGYSNAHDMMTLMLLVYLGIFMFKKRTQGE